jgi:ESF2/ABP1 family protein
VSTSTVFNSLFRWDYLTEKFAYEKRVKENKLKVAMVAAKRSNAEMSDLIEKTQVQKHVQDRKRKRDDNDNSTQDGEAAQKAKLVRQFRQNKLIGAQYGERESRVDGSLLKAVFGHSK